MKNLMTKQNLMIAGAGLLTAYLVYNVLVNRDKKKALKTPVKSDETSDFCGCGA